MNTITDTKINVNSHQWRQPPTATIKLQFDLAAAAFRTKQVSILITWLRLRAICSWGSGFLDYTLAVKELSTVFSMSQRSAIRALQQGDGKLWAISNIKGKVAPKGRSTVVLQGFKAACLYFGIRRLTDTHWRSLTADKFCGMAKARAEVYAAIVKPVGIRGNPMSRETLTSMTGLHKVQQRRYEVVAKVKRTPNYGMALQGSQVVPERVEIFTRSKGFRSVNKRLPNTYHSQQEAGPRGILRRVNKSLCLKAPIGSFIPNVARGLTKRYFSSPKRLVKALKARAGGDGYYLLRNRGRLLPGRLEWASVSL